MREERDRRDESEREMREMFDRTQRELRKDLEKMQEKSKEPEKKFNENVKIALDLLENLKCDCTKVIVMSGAQGSGKSTLCKHMFKINEAKPDKGGGHGTKDLTLLKSRKLSYPIVDSIGKIPDARGFMRVMACVINKGWDPVATIVVSNNRPGVLDTMAGFVQAAKINLIRFEPLTFWSLVNSNYSINEALKLTIHNEESPLPRINYMSPSKLSVEYANITLSLSGYLSTLTWEKSQSLKEMDAIESTLAYFFAKCIAERKKFRGSDLQFLDMEG